MKDIIFNNDSVNIFVDGSICDITDDYTVGCSGAVLVEYNNGYTQEYTHTRINLNTTNNDTEIRSIELGFDVMVDYVLRTKTLPTFNIFSDSKICVYGLREWIYNWINNNVDGVLYGSSGPVKNQEVIKTIIVKMLYNKIPFNLFHQKGHVNWNSKASMDKAISTFNVSNKCKVDDIELIKTISYYNDYVDLFTKQVLNVHINMNQFDKFENKLFNPFIVDLSKFDMSRYGVYISY